MPSKSFPLALAILFLIWLYLFNINYSSPQDPENQQNTKEIAEHQARKSALTIVGSILKAATELMIMGLGVGDVLAVQVLSSAPLLTTLVPLILAHIKSVAVSDPRVSWCLILNALRTKQFSKIWCLAA